MEAPHCDEVKIIKKYHNPEDCNTWFYFPIIMPLVNGKGPATDKECDQITFEVWDRFCGTCGVFDYLSDAVNHAIKLNNALLKEY